MNVLLAIVALGVLIFIHELGHFLASRAVRVPVQEFALGFGPAILRYRGKETLYRFNVIPFGGYVRFFEAGDPPASDGSSAVPYRPDPDRFFTARPVWEKVVITAAGVIGNFALAVAVFALVGTPALSKHAYIMKVFPSSLAAKADLHPGDKVLTINGQTADSPQRVVQIIQRSPSQVTFRLERGGRVLTRSSAKAYPTERLGIMVGQTMIFQRSGNPLLDLADGFRQTWILVGQILHGLGRLFTSRSGFNQVTGPVGVVQVTAGAARQGPGFLAYFVAIISIQLGIVNLLPIPGLDGGHLLIFGIEALKRRPLNPARVGWVNLMGILLLLTFMVAVTFRDIARLLKISG